MMSSRSGSSSATRISTSHRRRQADAERGALVRLAVDREPAALELHQRQGDGQAQTRARLLTLAVAVAGAEELLEHPALVLGAQARPAVADDDVDRVGAAPNVDAQLTIPGAVLAGVAQQVHQHLLEAARVGQHR